MSTEGGIACWICNTSPTLEDADQWRVIGATKPSGVGPVQYEAGALFPMCGPCGDLADAAAADREASAIGRVEAWEAIARRAPSAEGADRARLALVGIGISGVVYRGVRLDLDQVNNFIATFA